MDVKVCSKCGEEKPLTEFYLRKGSHINVCKTCKKEYKEEYLRSKKGIVTSIYNQQTYNSKKRGHPSPSYSKKELKEWLYSQKEFHELYDNWKASNYDTRLKPSCDRLDDYKPYTLDNLQITTWRKNNTRVHEDMKNGINNKQNRAVLQFDLNGEFITEHYSISEAGRKTGNSIGNIHMVCSGIRGKAGGFIWKFKE